MVWALLYVLQAYVVGFYFVSNRAKAALEIADKHWPEGEEDGRRDVDGCNGYKDITLLGCSQRLYTKEQWVHYSRNIHIMWFVTSVLWADVVCVIKFVKFIVADINPQIALVFERDLSSGINPTKENLDLKEQIKAMQKQFDELALAKKEQ